MAFPPLKMKAAGFRCGLPWAGAAAPVPFRQEYIKPRYLPPFLHRFRRQWEAGAGCGCAFEMGWPPSLQGPLPVFISEQGLPAFTY